MVCNFWAALNGGLVTARRSTLARTPDGGTATGAGWSLGQGDFGTMAEIIDLLPAAAGFLMMLGLSLLLCSEDLADDLRDRA